MFGDGNDSGSSGVSGSGSGLSGGFSGGSDSSSSDSSPNSSGLGSGLGGYGSGGYSGMGGFGGLAGNSSGYGASDGSGGIHSSLDSGGMSAPSGGTSTPSTNSLGSQAASNDASTQASTPTTSYAATNDTNNTNNTPANGFAPSQTDSSDHLSNAGFSFNPNTTNTTNDNTTTLNGVAGSSLTPQGITGGTPYTNGFSIDSSTIGRDLSTITPNYDSDMSHYFNDTSGIQKTEDTLTKIDSAWDTVKQWGNEYVVQPVQAAWDAFKPDPESNQFVTPLEDNTPSVTKQESVAGLNNYKLDASAGNMLNPDQVATAANLGSMLSQNQITSVPKDDAGQWQFSINPLGSADNAIGTVSASTESSLAGMQAYVSDSLSNMPRPNNIQAQVWNKNIATEIAQFGKVAEKIGTVAKYAGYTGVGVGVGVGVYDNIQNGAVPEKIVSDAVVDTGFGLGGLGASAISGAFLGSFIPIPVVGTTVGVLAGGAAYMVGTEMVQPGGKSLKDSAKEGAYNLIK